MKAILRPASDVTEFLRKIISVQQTPYLLIYWLYKIWHVLK